MFTKVTSFVPSGTLVREEFGKKGDYRKTVFLHGNKELLKAGINTFELTKSGSDGKILRVIKSDGGELVKVCLNNQRNVENLRNFFNNIRKLGLHV
jgi:hypothetical protein